MTFYSQEIRNIGKLITLGSLNLSLTLRLERTEIQNLKINFRRLKTINDLNFIIENESFWERIELSSKNELLNTLFHMNKIKRVKNIVAYLVYERLQFNEEQMKFQRLLDYILLTNGVVIYSFDICKCKMNISFKIVYKNYVKKVMFLGDEEYDDEETNLDNPNEFDYNDLILNNINNTSKTIDEYVKSNNNNSKTKLETKETKGKDEEKIPTEEDEEEESNEIDDNEDNIGLFERLPENEVNFGEFKYIYIHFRDYILDGEFSELFKFEEIYNFLKKIKKDSKVKIIFNFSEGLKSSWKYIIKFLKISDIHIFRKKSELLEILIKLNERENKKRLKKNKMLLDVLKARKSHYIKKIRPLKNRNESQFSSQPRLKLNQLYKISGENPDNDHYLKRLENNVNQSLKNIILIKSQNLSVDNKKRVLIDKTNLFNYLHKILFSPNSDLSQEYLNNKLGIYLDDFKKIYIADYKRTKPRPDLIEYDFNIYPKSNVHKLKEIEILREILYSRYSMFSYIIYGCILSTILDDLIKGKESYYLFYFYIRVSVLKILSLLKKGTPIPTNKEFYIVELKKNELKKIISDENTKRKENGFNMNYLHQNYKLIPKKIERVKSPIPKIDKFGTLNMDYTLSKEMFSESNKILNETNNGTLNNDFNTITNQRFMRLTRERNFNRGFLTKKHGYKNSFSSVGGVPEYAVYLSKKDRRKLKLMKKKLPPIKIQKRNKFEFMNSKLEQYKDEKEGEEEEKIDTSKYKEIIFQPTQGET